MSNKSAHDMPDFMVPGWSARLGTHTFSSEEIVEFASEFDPQPFHTDTEAAKSSLFGALCASGWHTASIWMRKQRDFTLSYLRQRHEAGLPVAEFGPSPGFENLNWLKPVYAGDTITYFNQTTACRKSGSRPGWYILKAASRGENQHGEDVLTFESTVLLKFPA